VGTFEVEIQVAGPSRTRFERVEALVDTGSTYTVLPRGLLRRLGVDVDSRARFKLADGCRVELDRGRAWVRLDDREQYTLVVFGRHALLGAVTLEEFLLVPDPVERRLVPVDALMMRLVA
jgi:aspartyl protease family protein